MEQIQITQENGIITIGNVVLPNFNQVNLYLDNDQAGRKAAIELISQFPANNKSAILYPQHKDFNEFLINQ